MDIICFLFPPVKIRLLPLATGAARFYHFFFFLLFFRVISGTYGDTMGRNAISQVTSFFFTPRSIINFRDRDSRERDSKIFFFWNMLDELIKLEFFVLLVKLEFFFIFFFFFFFIIEFVNRKIIDGIIC